MRGYRPKVSSERSIPCLPPRKHATSARMATRERRSTRRRHLFGSLSWAKGPSGPVQCQQPHHPSARRRNVVTRALCGAEAAAATVSCRDWECKHRPAARAQAPRNEQALFRCTCVNAPTDRTTERQPPHRHEHTARSATASPGLAAVAEQPCRLGLVASTCHTSQSTFAAGAKQRVPVRDAEGRVCVLFVSSEYVATPYCTV